MICVPVSAGTNEAALRAIKRCAPLADVIEIRIDRIDMPDLPRLLKDRKTPTLITNRKKSEGGAFVGSEDRRCALLAEAVGLGADMVDIELGTNRRYLKKVARAVYKSEGKTKLIISHHDFGGTPAEGCLRSIVEESRDEGAHIVKVVTWAREMKDNLRILKLVQWAGAIEQRIIGFCMGEKGRISRIAAPSFGSCMSYAALDEDHRSAPGQLTLGETQSVLKITGV